MTSTRVRWFRPVLFAVSALFHISCAKSTPTGLPRDASLGEWEVEYPLSNRSIQGMWAGDGVAYAVGRDGLILRYDGSRWTLDNSPVTTSLSAVWGAGADDVYAVGAGGVVLHTGGTGWVLASVPNDGGTLTSVAGTSGTDVWVAGLNDNVAHFDGTGWTAVSPGGAHDYRSVWANDDGSVFLGADSVLVWDRFTWTPTALAPGAFTVSLWGLSYTDMYAANVTGAPEDTGVYRFDGSTWECVYETGAQGPRVIVGAAANDIYAVGTFVENGAAHWDGEAWREITDGVGGGAACLDGPDLLTGNSSGAVTRYDGARSAYEPGLAVVDLYGVWTWATGAFVVGELGTILRHDGGEWECMESGTTATLRGVWGASAFDAFAVGDGVITHYDGSAWSAATLGATSALRDVWGTSGTNVYAVGDDGVILHYDGGGWSAAAAFAPLLTSIWGTSAGDVYAAGNTGELFHEGGMGWSQVDGPESLQLTDVWGEGGVLFAVEPRANITTGIGVGPAGRIHLFDGAQWRVTVDSLFTRPVRLWGTSSRDVFAVGTEFIFPGSLPFIEIGRLLHYDGTEWKETGVEVPHRLLAVSGTARGDAIAVGDGATIIRARR